MAHGARKSGAAGEGWEAHPGDLEAKAHDEGTLTLEQQLQKDREADTASQREMFTGAAGQVTAAAEAKAGVAAKGGAQARKDIERGVAEGLAASTQKDIRSLAGAASEARAKGAGQILETELYAQDIAGEAAATKMDEAVAIKEAGSEAEDIEIMDQELDSKMRASISRNKGIDDDEEAIVYEIMDSIKHLPRDHPMYIKYSNYANDIASDKWDV